MNKAFDVFHNVSKIHNNNNVISRSINSFDKFYSWLVKILSTSVIKSNDFEIKFSNVRIGKPRTNKGAPLFPNECRLKGLNYISDVIWDCILKINNESTSKIFKFKDIVLFKLPIMLLSSRCNLHGKTKPDFVKHRECYYQTGGFFILNGKSKVILTQEKIASNISQTYIKNKSQITKII